ncbi:uncharacterized protein HKW66_Vig0011800 [Vigna angularis]|uniref:Uncharacterized protein n=1 Tax=Phaseolus angularis TaxID=3914 RepID=A0A8T0LIY9_PHAAN|nr:uncharacterized protein HKW66_Vig0011800 [Vigna angularis]
MECCRRQRAQCNNGRNRWKLVRLSEAIQPVVLQVKGMTHILGEGERGHMCLMRKKKPRCEEGNVRRECRQRLIWPRAGDKSRGNYEQFF